MQRAESGGYTRAPVIKLLAAQPLEHVGLQEELLAALEAARRPRRLPPFAMPIPFSVRSHSSAQFLAACLVP